MLMITVEQLVYITSGRHILRDVRNCDWSVLLSSCHMLLSLTHSKTHVCD